MTRFAISLLLVSFLLVPSLLASDGEQSQFFDSDGVKIHFVEKGAGDPVVLIHGFSASYQMNWGLPGIIDALATNYHVIAIDNRGHGKSGKPHKVEQYGVNMVEDVVRLLDHLKIEKAHIVGYSMGGFITANLVARHPDRVVSAVIGAAGWYQNPEPHFALLDKIGDSLEAGTGITPLLIKLTPEGQPAPTKEVLKAASLMVMLMNDPKALAAAIRGMRGLVVDRKELEENKIPTVAIVGSIDPLKDGVDEMAAVMNNLELVVIDGADHMTAIGNPELLGTIQEHLKKHSLATVATVTVTNATATNSGE